MVDVIVMAFSNKTAYNNGSFLEKSFLILFKVLGLASLRSISTVSASLTFFIITLVSIPMLKQ